LLELIPDKDPVFREDAKLLHERRGTRVGDNVVGDANDAPHRALHRAILDLTVTAPIGDLLDVGCGRGAILKLLASRANRAVASVSPCRIDAGWNSELQFAQRRHVSVAIR